MQSALSGCAGLCVLKFDMSLPVVLGLLWVVIVLLWGWQARPKQVRKPANDAYSTYHAHSASSAHSAYSASSAHDAHDAYNANEVALAKNSNKALTIKPATVALAVTAIAVMAIQPVLGIAMAIACWVVPQRRRAQQHRKAQAAITNELPEATELLRLAISSGLNIHQSVVAVAKRLFGPVGRGLASVAQQVDSGKRLGEALETLPHTVGEPIRPLVRVLIDSDRYGTDLEPALAQLAADSRLMRRRHAEELARKLPLRLLGPLVFCILPAFVLLTLAPVLADTISMLRSEL